MDYTQVTIYSTHAGEEAVTARLCLLGITGVEIEDETDFNEFLENNRQYWDYVDNELREKMAGETKIKAYLPVLTAPQTVQAIRQEMDAMRAQDGAHAYGRLTLETVHVSEEDWANNWKKYFKPTPVGNVLIRPAWEPLSEEVQGYTVFSINPGMTFGTGTHETTRLCVQAAQRYVRKGAQVLDLGCGSGILSLISLLLGAEKATAVDIDPIARDTVLENAALNGIPEEVLEVYTGDVLTDDMLRARVGAGYDLVFANIVADVIIGLAPFIARVLASDGVLVTSGIIEGRRDEVAQALAGHRLFPVEEDEEKGWHCLCCKKG
ncbi:50S ribosomal protein L11 methyltransferase [Ethanoligenens harbinense]|uniref:Ribosomal protein L11 methyltransferase n=2 Tax=Ethanoligenens harbinense TaxID=253239 RepID=E6U736_ETHHY|nr:50S ribosomal protein L11 methyltransferase [Ethanoligenens harbinense]ADU28106.1 ribosomal protein L11 methyltransferase [Ethanoligenens harbinense YUAN-3]